MPEPLAAYEPRIVAFFCNWCTYTASDLAGTQRLKYAPSTRVIRVMCSGRIDPQFVLAALEGGADGVLIGGCHPGDCHYQEGNTKCLRRFKLLAKYLAALGVEPDRVRLEWIAASEGEKLQRVTDEMTARLRELGPPRLARPPRPAPCPPPAPAPGGAGKPKVGFYWCAGCGGCEESVVDLAEDILDVVGAVDFAFFPVAMDFKRADVEGMADGEMAVCFVNGAVRSSEQREMVELLRRKARLLIAYGSCACQGGVPGLMNAADHDRMLRWVYEESPTTANPGHTRPAARWRAPEGELELPTLDASVKTLAQTVEVDYFIPGCAPPVRLLKDALSNILSGNLPSRGSTLAPDIALCHECPRLDSKPDDLCVTRFERAHRVTIDPERCLLAQGLACLGASTRSGCGAACVLGNMPCTGCLGPLGRSQDQGLASLSALASIICASDAAGIDAAVASVPDPVGTFHRYGLPGSRIHLRVAPPNGGEGTKA